MKSIRFLLDHPYAPRWSALVRTPSMGMGGARTFGLVQSGNSPHPGEGSA